MAASREDSLASLQELEPSPVDETPSNNPNADSYFPAASSSSGTSARSRRPCE